jgi:hypothetical protein
LICISIHYMSFFLKKKSAVAAAICYFSIHSELFDCSPQIFNVNCNLYEPRFINDSDSYISVHLRPRLWENITVYHPVRSMTITNHWNGETIICVIHIITISTLLSKCIRRIDFHRVIYSHQQSMARCASSPPLTLLES